MIVLQETLRGVFYAPFYAALARDAFGEEGVEIRFVSSPAPGRALEGLMDGSVDVGWGGPMRVNEGYARIPGADFKCFAEVVTRDPFFLVTRDPRPPFDPAALIGLRVGTVSEVPTPWLCLQHDIRLAGADPAGIAASPTRAWPPTLPPSAAASWTPPNCSSPLWRNSSSRAATSGTRPPIAAPVPTPRSTRGRASSPESAKNSKPWCAPSTGPSNGSHRLMPPPSPRTSPASSPDLPPSRLEAACARYQRLGIWGRDPVLPRDGYDRLLASMRSAGFVDPGTPFEVAVDNSLAEAAIGGGQ